MFVRLAVSKEIKTYKHTDGHTDRIALYILDALYYCPSSVYPDVTLDRSLTNKQHIINIKTKIVTRNNILRKLTPMN